MDDIRAVVVGFIVDGNTKRDIVEWLKTNRPEVKHPDKLFEEACDDIRTQARDTRTSDPAFVVVALKELYRRAVEVGDHKVAAGILGQLDKTLRS